MKKYILSLFLIVCIQPVFATVSDFKIDEFSFEINYNYRDHYFYDTVTLEYYAGCRDTESTNNSDGNIEIPAYVTYDSKTYKVKSIGAWAFSGCVGLTSVIIPSTVTSIDNYAFANCTALTSINIPGNVGTIYDCTFQGCTRLKSVVLEDATSYLDVRHYTESQKPEFNEKLFDGCPVEYIYWGRNCSEIYLGESLQKIEFGSLIKQISYGEFNCATHKCYNLKEIVFPETIEKITLNAFFTCTKLEKIYVPRLEPPVLDWAVFTIPVFNKAELHIPKGTKQKYADVKYWNQFVNVIDDIEVSGIDDICTETDTSTITVYNLQGQEVLRTTEAEELNTLSEGIYIKVVANKSEKIVIR